MHNYTFYVIQTHVVETNWLRIRLKKPSLYILNMCSDYN